jgi:hypothetical protein
MIVSLHLATGAATGELSRSRRLAVASGPVLHVLSDRVPHRHPDHLVWDYVASAIAFGVVARSRGMRDAATLGAVAAVIPDLEHVLPARGPKVFHRRRRRRRAAGLSVGTQLGLTAVMLVPLLARRRPWRDDHREHPPVPAPVSRGDGCDGSQVAAEIG